MDWVGDYIQAKTPDGRALSSRSASRGLSTRGSLALGASASMPAPPDRHDAAHPYAGPAWFDLPETQSSAPLREGMPPMAASLESAAPSCTVMERMEASLAGECHELGRSRGGAVAALRRTYGTVDSLPGVAGVTSDDVGEGLGATLWAAMDAGRRRRRPQTSVPASTATGHRDRYTTPDDGYADHNRPTTALSALQAARSSVRIRGTSHPFRRPRRRKHKTKEEKAREKARWQAMSAKERLRADHMEQLEREGWSGQILTRQDGAHERLRKLPDVVLPHWLEMEQAQREAIALSHDWSPARGAMRSRQRSSRADLDRPEPTREPTTWEQVNAQEEKRLTRLLLGPKLPQPYYGPPGSVPAERCRPAGHVRDSTGAAGHTAAELPPRLRAEVARAGAGWLMLRGDTPLYIVDESEAEKAARAAREAAEAEAATQARAQLLQSRSGSDASSLEEDELVPKEWPGPERQVRAHLRQLQILVEKSLQRKLFEVWPEIEEGFCDGVHYDVIPNDNMVLSFQKLLALLRSEDLYLVEADVQRVIARSFWGVENVEEASLTFAAFKDEWWPSDEDRRAWGPLAEKKRRERALEKKERERLRREYEAEQARKRRELTKQMTKALNDVLNTSGIANSIDRARARRVLHVLLFGTRKTVTLYGDIPPAGKGRPTCPLRVRLAHARQRVIDAYCSHRGLEAEGGGILTTIQATQVLHGHAAEWLQLFVRGWSVRRRMRRMEEMYQAALRRMLREHTLAWHVVAKWRIALKENCLRKVREWRYYLVQQRRRRHYFRVCFWPFYVWHRAAHRTRIAKQKAVFLLRVDRGLVHLRHFRAWKVYIDAKLERRAKTEALRVELLHRKAKRDLQRWHTFAKAHAEKFLIWRTAGKKLRADIQMRDLRKYLLVWRYHSTSKKMVQLRSFQYFNYKLTRKKVPKFPRVLLTPWGERVKKDDRNLARLLKKMCEPRWQKQVQKDRFQLRVQAMNYRRLVPKTFKAWLQFWDGEKQWRYATYCAAERLQRKVFFAFKRAVQSERNKRLGVLDPEKLERRMLEEARRKAEKERERLVKEAEARETFKNEWNDEAGWRKVSLEQQREKKVWIKRQMQYHAKEQKARFAREEAEERRAETRKEMKDSVKKHEKEKTKAAEKATTKTAKRLLQRRAKQLHDAMFRAYEQAENMHMKHVTRMVLRQLRLPMMTRRSETLYRRAKLRNWCRICARYKYLWRAMPVYRRIRTKWVCFSMWLRFMGHRFAIETPSLAAEVRRRRDLANRFDIVMQKRGVDIKTDEHSARTKVSDNHAFFLRWVQYTQWRVCCRKLAESSCHRRRHRLLRRTFGAWFTGLRPTHSYENRVAKPTFIEERINADVSKLRLRLQQFMYNMESNRIRRLWSWRRRATRRRALAEPTLKKLLMHVRQQVGARQALERSLLLQAFEQRGLSKFVDSAWDPQGGDGGQYFEDTAAPPNTRVISVVLNESEIIDGISLVTKSGPETMRSPHRGRTTGKRVEFKLTADEDLVRVEGLAGRRIHRLRFWTSSGRRSRWYGRTRMGEPFDLSGDTSNQPLGDVIVGLCGRCTQRSLDALGIVVRRTTEVHVFSRCWLQAEQEIGTDGAQLDPGSLAEDQFAHMMRMRACDIELALDRSCRLAKLMWRTRPDPKEAQAKYEREYGANMRRRNSLFGTDDNVELARQKSGLADSDQAHREQQAAPKKKWMDQVPPPLDTLRFIESVAGHWTFNSLSSGLLPLPADIGEGERKMREGKAMVAKGAEQREAALAALEEIEGYDPQGNHALPVSQMGATRVTALLQRIEDLENKRDEGGLAEARGHALLAKGKSLLPAIPIGRARVMEYFQHLYKLAQTSSTLAGLNV